MMTLLCKVTAINKSFEQGHLDAYMLTRYNNLTFDSEREQSLY